MSLVETMVNLLANMDAERITVHAQRCISVRNRNAACQRCVESCAAGALAWNGEEVEVQPARCIGCGTCATACPTSAIELTNPTDADMVAGLKRTIRATHGRPVVCCEQAQAAADRLTAQGCVVNPAAVLTVPCLGRVDEALLVGAAAYGSECMTLVCGDCATCAHAAGGQLARRVVESARGLLAGFGAGMAVELSETIPDYVMVAPRDAHPAPASPAASKREAFEQAAHDVSEYAREKVDPHTGTLSHYVPSRRTMLYNYLNHIGLPTETEVTSRVVGNVEIDTQACTGCRACATFCPTGALFRVDEEGAYGLAHRSAACMQCRACEQVCRAGAITVHDTVPAAQFMGKKVVYWDMPRPTWTPNRPDSMYNKFHEIIGSDMPMCMF